MVTIPNYPEYVINELGEIFTLKTPGARGKVGNTPRRLYPAMSSNGYLRVTLTSKDNILRTSVHRLVASIFIPNPENKPMVNHKDGIKFHNNVDNLEWVTSSENNKHAIYSGIVRKLPNGLKLSLDEVENIRDRFNEFLEDICLDFDISKRQLKRILLEINWDKNGGQ